MATEPMTDTLLPTTTGRWDLYGPVHKGLRRAHCTMLQRLARTDFTRDCVDLLDDLRILLAMGALHLTDEERFIHRALEERSPGATEALERDHAHHRARFADLEQAIRAVEAAARPDQAAQAGRALHLMFTRFVAEDFTHMAEEETQTWPLLCALFTDAELAGIEMSIVGSLPPDMAMRFLQLMVPAVNTPERIALLAGMKGGAPADIYAAVYREAAVPALSREELAELEAAELAA